MTATPAWLDELSFVVGGDRGASGPPWLHVGLSRVDGWEFVVDADRPEELADRHRLLHERRDEVVVSLPCAAPANREVLALVERWWRACFADAPTVDGGVDPIEAAGRLVQEDLCVLLPDEDGFRLAAGCVCFPSHWRLAEKLGRSVTEIHRPVPGYDVELADRVDRFLQRLRPGVVARRRNWTVHDRPDRFAPWPPAPDDRVTLAGPDEVGTRRWLRSERQTLRRLPGSGAVLFTIKTQRVPFAVLADRPDVASALAAHLRSQPAALTEANGIGADLPLVLEWLDATGADPTVRG